MVVPTKWQAFRKRYIDQARHDDYPSALREVSAGWAIAKELRDSRTPNWRAVAETRMQALIDENTQRRAAGSDRADTPEDEPAEAPPDAPPDASPDASPEAPPEAPPDGRVEEPVGQPAQDGVDELLSKDIPDTAQAGAIWQGGWKIGGRPPNTATAWVRLDAQMTVADRRVLKDTTVEPWQWVDLTRWTGPDLRDLENRQHMDYCIQRKLCMVPGGGQNFVHAGGYRNFPDRYGYRTVQEYCDQGDLAALIRRHPDRVPEPLVWRVLEQLAKAAIVMEKGSLAGEVAEWQQIIHCDLKPDNVFLTTSNIPGDKYPNAKLGDFEMSLQTSVADPFNPQILREISANGLSWAAPEARSHDSRWMCIKVSKEEVDFLDEEYLLSPISIWGIGICLWEMMNGEIKYKFYEHGAEDEDEDAYSIVNYSQISMKHEDPFFRRWEDAAVTMYSSYLRGVVDSCLRDLPSDRITPSALLDLVQRDLPDVDDDDEDETADDRGTAQWGKKNRDGMDIDEEYQWPVFVGFQTAYRIGFAMPDIETAE